MSTASLAQTLRLMIQWAREHPGQPVALLYDGVGEQIGIMSIFPEDEDWYQDPVPLSVLTQADEPVKSSDGSARRTNGDVAQW